MTDVLDSLIAVWESRALPLPAPAWAVAAAVGLVMVFYGRLWRWTRWWLTTVHEAGHAIVGRLTGRRRQSIHLHARSGGTTWSIGRAGWRSVPGTLAGYPAPAWLGAGLLAAAATGRASQALLVAAVVGLLLLTRARNARAVLAYATVTAVAAAGVWQSMSEPLPPPLTMALVALGIASLVGAIRDWAAERRVRRRGEITDAVILSSSTRLPATAWWLIMGTAILAAAVPLALLVPWSQLPLTIG